jgi:hypothetical protein
VIVPIFATPPPTELLDPGRGDLQVGDDDVEVHAVLDRLGLRDALEADSRAIIATQQAPIRRWRWRHVGLQLKEDRPELAEPIRIGTVELDPTDATRRS